MCHKEVLTVRESACVLRSPASDGSTWELVEGGPTCWARSRKTSNASLELSLQGTSVARKATRISDARTRDAFEPVATGAVEEQSYATEEVADLMRQKAAEGLLFASDLELFKVRRVPRGCRADGP